jgi:protease I
MMKKILILFLVVVIIIVGALVYFNYQKPKGPPKVETILMPEKTFKKAVMIIAFKNFRDEEYFVPKEVLEKAGIEVKTASNKKGLAIGADGGEVNVDLLVEEVDPKNFDAIIFVGGPGCLSNLDNENSYQLARKTIEENKVLAAICISPVILAKAGVLEGKRATVWSSPMDRGTVKILEEKGAIYEEESVVTDGKIITANGPASAKKFAQAIIEALKK